MDSTTAFSTFECNRIKIYDFEMNAYKAITFQTTPPRAAHEMKNKISGVVASEDELVDTAPGSTKSND